MMAQTSGPERGQDTPQALTVLVIDDHEAVASSIARACEALGAKTAIVNDASVVPAILQAALPDAIILDLMMPDRDGLDVLHDLSKQHPQLPVLVISGLGDAWLTVGRRLGRLLDLRNVKVAAKPLDLAVLRGFLADVAARQLRDQA